MAASGIELRPSHLDRRAGDLLSPNLPKSLEIFGQVTLSSFQHFLKRSHTMPVIPILSVSSGLVGRSPEITTYMTSVSLLGKKAIYPSAPGAPSHPWRKFLPLEMGPFVQTEFVREEELGSHEGRRAL
jgi:hypothetical protein